MNISTINTVAETSSGLQRIEKGILNLDPEKIVNGDQHRSRITQHERDLRKEYWVNDYQPPLEDFTDIVTDKSLEESVDEVLNVCR